MLAGDGALQCWAFNDPDPADLELWAIITVDDEKTLDELRSAGWEISLAPPGIYSPSDWHGVGCIVLSEGGRVEDWAMVEWAG